MCATCTAVADAVLLARREGASNLDLRDSVVELCVDLEIETEDVCVGAIDRNIVSYSVESFRKLQPYFLRKYFFTSSTTNRNCLAARFAPYSYKNTNVKVQ